MLIKEIAVAGIVWSEFKLGLRIQFARYRRIVYPKCRFVGTEVFATGGLNSFPGSQNSP